MTCRQNPTPKLLSVVIGPKTAFIRSIRAITLVIGDGDSRKVQRQVTRLGKRKLHTTPPCESERVLCQLSVVSKSLQGAYMR